MNYCPYCGNKIDSTGGNCACGWMPQKVDGECQYWSHAPLFAATPALVSDGITRRELFAAMAMQGFCSVPGSIATADEISNWAVEQADALIEALNKEEGPADA